MHPSFFGPEGEQLLGIHHPARGASRGLGVILCAPAPMESARTHWAFRKLADLLAKTGYDVLRFDYRGTGDSQGELPETTPSMWIEDIKRAARELKDVAGVRKVAAVGFRFGALLLAQAASQGLTLEALVMWEPVVSVANWLAQLKNIETQVHRGFHSHPPSDRTSVLGYVVPVPLQQQWGALDLAAVPAWSAKTDVVVAADSPQFERLRRSWAQSTQQANWHIVASAAGTPTTGALLGNEALEEIVRAIGDKR